MLIPSSVRPSSAYKHPPTADSNAEYYSNTDEGREGYLEDTREFLAEIDQKLPEFFGTLPKAELVVKRVEEFREVDGGAQHYQSATPDGSRPGVYYVHMSDMSAYSKTDMETTAYHEGSPGHHMQVSIAQELTNVPIFRTLFSITVCLGSPPIFGLASLKRYYHNVSVGDLPILSRVFLLACCSILEGIDVQKLS